MKHIRTTTTGEFVNFWCFGCAEYHSVNIKHHNTWGALWSWNGDVEKPTLHPSLNICINSPKSPSYQPRAKTSICHSFIRDGKIEYLPDCTHVLAGKTVEMREEVEHP